MPDDARFCAVCGEPVALAGAPVPPPVAPVPPPPPAVAPPVPPAPSGCPVHTAYGAGGYGAPPAGPGKKTRTGLWIGIAAAAVIVIAAAVAVPLLVRGDDDGTTTDTTRIRTTTSTTAHNTVTTVTSSSESTTTTVSTAGMPGDSAGEWVEMDIPAITGEAYGVAVSDEAVVIEASTDNGHALYAYMIESGDLVELPIEGPNVAAVDIDGLLAVWWEFGYDDVTNEYSNEHIYAYTLPNGPKVDVSGEGSSGYYPQVAGQWITWVEEEPWETSPDEYWVQHIYGVEVNAQGEPEGDPAELVPAALAYVQGDSGWTYSLSETHLVWENAAAIDLFDAGTYAMDLGSLQPQMVGSEFRRPTLAGDTLVYFLYGNGLEATDLLTQQVYQIDPLGDFATAGPTFAAYFRDVDSADETMFEIVARGFTGGYEQVLGEQDDAPWLSPFIAASDNRVAFVADGVVHLFEWQGR